MAGRIIRGGFLERDEDRLPEKIFDSPAPNPKTNLIPDPQNLGGSLQVSTEPEAIGRVIAPSTTGLIVNQPPFIPVANDERIDFETDDPSGIRSFFTGITAGPITRFAFQRLSTPLIGESGDQRDTRAGRKFDEGVAAAQEAAPIVFGAGRFTGEMLDLAIAGGIVRKVAFKAIGKIASKTLRRAVRGGAIGATAGAGGEAIEQAFTEERINALNIAKEGIKEGVLFGITDAGLGKVVDLWRAGRAARLTTKQAKLVANVVNKKLNQQLNQKSADGVTKIDELLSPAIDGEQLSFNLVSKQVKGFKVKTKNDAINTPNKTNNPPVNKDRLLEKNIERLSGEDDILKGTRFKKKFTKESVKAVDDAAKDETIRFPEIRAAMESGIFGEASSMTKAQRLTNLTRMKNTMQKADDLMSNSIKADSKNITKEEAARATEVMLDALKAAENVSGHQGEMLNALKVQLGTSEDQAIKTILKTVERETRGSEALRKKMVDAWVKVDKTNFNEISKFHREFVKPTFGDMLEAYRYINLLSSPKTHIVNAFSNLLQTTLPVFDKTVTAFGDWALSGLRGTQRQNFFLEAPLYVKGLFTEHGDALRNAAKFLTGELAPTQFEFRRIPLFAQKGGGLTKRILSSPPLLMEAADAYFRTMIAGGERAANSYAARRLAGTGRGEAFKAAARKGRALEGLPPQVAKTIDEKALRTGEYLMFRQELFAEGQGNLLNLIDNFTDKLLKAREKLIVPFVSNRTIPGTKTKIGQIKLLAFAIPFVQTSSNILKQGIERSPFGYFTMIGNKNKAAQFAKATVGSQVMIPAAMLAMADRTTWQVPKDSLERDLFFRAGMKPYSIKIGNKWLSYKQLGPIGIPLAITAAFKAHWTKNGADVAAGEKLFEAMVGGMQGIFQLFFDQSYVKGMGDVMDAVAGEPEKINKFTANALKHVIPYVSLFGWIDRAAFKVYNDPKGFKEHMENGIPGLSVIVTPRLEDPSTVLERQFPYLNSFSPLGISEEDPELADLFASVTQVRQEKFLAERQQEEFNRRIARGLRPETFRIFEFLREKIGDEVVLEPVDRSELLKKILTTQELKEGKQPTPQQTTPQNQPPLPLPGLQ